MLLSTTKLLRVKGENGLEKHRLHIRTGIASSTRLNCLKIMKHKCNLVTKKHVLLKKFLKEEEFRKQQYGKTLKNKEIV